MREHPSTSCARGEKRKAITAGEMDISERWVYQIWAHHRRTGKIPDSKNQAGHVQSRRAARFFGTFESGWEQFGSVPDYISYYNEYRLHPSLDADAGETPRRAFANKKASYAIRKTNPRWFEEDSNQARKRSGRSCSLTSSQALD